MKDPQGEGNSDHRELARAGAPAAKLGVPSEPCRHTACDTPDRLQRTRLHARSAHRVAVAANLALMRDLRPIVVVAAVLSLVLWPVQISSAFGLPAHPLILHVPVVFVPVLGIATLIAVAKPDWFGVPLAVFAVVTLAATLLTVGAGEAFLESKPRLEGNPMMKDHQGAGETVRFCMVLLTAALLGPAVGEEGRRGHGAEGRGRADGRVRAGLHDPHRAPRGEARVGGGRARVDRVNEIVDPVKYGDDRTRRGRARVQSLLHGQDGTHPRHLRPSAPRGPGHVRAGARDRGGRGAQAGARTSTPGQLSRVLAKLEEQGLISKAPSPLDARRQLVRLTEAGKERFAAMDKDSADAIGAVLDGLGDACRGRRRDGAAQARDRAGRHAHAARVRARRPRLDGAAPRRAVRPRVRLGPELRAPRRPDRRRLRPDHGPRLGRGDRRRTAWARSCASAWTRPPPSSAPCSSSRKRAARASAKPWWTRSSATPAASGYTTLKLWTQSHLHAAIRIYESRGFVLEHEWPDPAFGKDDLVSQTWSLTLKP